MSLELLLETDPAQLWQQTQTTSRQDSWIAYLNQLCITALLPWFQEEFPQAKTALNSASRSSVWAFVSGTAFNVGGLRFVVIPTEAIDHDEFRIPQEWIDLPSWAGDYYLAAQVEPDESCVKVWGYATHHTVKTRGRLDFNDRTYCLTSDDLLSDVGLLWLSRELCPQEPIRAEVPALPTLPLEQAKNLIDRLGNPELLSPRLAVPFQTWGALMEHGGWRQQLSQHRQGQPETQSILQWLQAGVSNVAQQLGWERVELQPSYAAARSAETLIPTEILSRRLAIAGQTYELQVIPQDDAWRFELRNTQPGGLIPGGFKLRLLTEDLQPFEGNEAIAENAVEFLFIEVALEEGEGIVWETEPISEGYDREILRF